VSVKRIVVAVVAAALATGAAAWARPAAAPTKTAGVLAVGLAPPAVNFQVGTVRGSKVVNPKGYEIDLARAIAKQLGISKVEWLNVPWTGLFKPGPKSFDITLQEATITTQRQKTVDFSSPYFYANQGVLVSKGTTPPKSLADLRKLQTCGQAVTTGLDFIQHKLRPQKAPRIYQTTAAAFTAVENGACQAFVMDTPIVASQKKAKPSAYGPVAGTIITKENYGAVLEKGSKLTPLVSAAIKKLNANGTNGALQKKWFRIDFTKLRVLK
jgi:polar amino acid transport system substrate-binding protein